MVLSIEGARRSSTEKCFIINLGVLVRTVLILLCFDTNIGMRRGMFLILVLGLKRLPPLVRSLI